MITLEVDGFGIPIVPADLARRVRSGDRPKARILAPSGWAGNAVRHGLAGLDVDGGRVPTGDEKLKDPGRSLGSYGTGNTRPWETDEGAIAGALENRSASNALRESCGRYPSNLALSPEAAEELGRQMPDLDKEFDDKARFFHTFRYQELDQDAGQRYTSGKCEDPSTRSARSAEGGSQPPTPTPSSAHRGATTSADVETEPIATSTGETAEPTDAGGIPGRLEGSGGKSSPGGSGSGRTDLSPRTTRSTTRTSTPPTTASTISNVSRSPITSGSMEPRKKAAERSSASALGAESGSPSEHSAETAGTPTASRASTSTRRTGGAATQSGPGSTSGGETASAADLHGGFRYHAKTSSAERLKGVENFFWRVSRDHPLGFERITQAEYLAMGHLPGCRPRRRSARPDGAHRSTVTAYGDASGEGLAVLDLPLLEILAAELEELPEPGCAEGCRHRQRYQGNPHPTLKPIELIKYLAGLVLPPDTGRPRRVLVLFAGTYSEVIGCDLAGWDEVVGIEAEPVYVEIGEARRRAWVSDAAVQLELMAGAAR